ncbi:MAG: tetratricopeptide repeat protein [candidate division WOR-3 bacterium]
MGILTAKALLLVTLGAMTYDNFYKAYQQAEMYFQRGEYDKALNIYKKIEKDAFGFEFGYEVRYRILECYFNKGDFNTAVKEFDKMSKDGHIKGTYMEQEIVYALAVAYAIRGDIQYAKQMVQTLQAYPYYKNSPRTKFLLGIIDYREGKFEEAVLKLAQADLPEAKFFYARTLAITRRPLDAIEIYKKLLTDYSGTPLEGLIQYGIIEANFLYGDYKGTATLAQEFIKRYHGHPLSDYVQYYWGVSLYRLDYYDQCLEKMSFLAKKKEFEFQGLAAYYAGNCQMRFKKYDDAIKYFQTARSLAGDNVVSTIAFLRMAESYFYKGDSAQAYLMADQLLSFPLAPEEGGIGEYMRGAISYSLNKYAAAVLSFQTVIENYPQSYFRRPAMAMTLLSLVKGQSFDQAVLKGNLYWPEINADTTYDLWDGWFIFGLAEGSYYANALGDAELRYNWNIQRTIHRDLILLSRLGLGWVFLHQGRYDDALAQFKSIEAAATDTSVIVAIHMGMGVCYFNNGKYEEAFREFAATANAFPERHQEMPDLIYYKGYSAQALKFWGDAIKFYEECLTKYPEAPRSAESAFKAADIYMKGGEYQKAGNLLSWLLEHYPNYYRAPRAQYMLAESKTLTKNYADALKEYDKYRTLYSGRDPELDKQVSDRMQQIYYLLTRDDPEIVEKFIHDFPESELAAAALYEQAAKAYDEKNDSLAAEIFFRVANEFPKSERTPDALFYSGTLFYKLKKFSEASVAFKKYKDFYPNGKQIKDVTHWLAMSYFGLAKYQESVATFEEELNKFPDSEFRGDALKFMGMAYVQMGQTAKAVKVFQQAVEVYNAAGRYEEATQLNEYIKTLPH